MYSIIAVALCKIHNKEEYNNNWLCKKVPPTTIVSALCILLHTIDIRTVFLTAIPTEFDNSLACVDRQEHSAVENQGQRCRPVLGFVELV